MQRVTDPSLTHRRPRGKKQSQLREVFLFTSFPQRIPHVSTPCAVLALANWRNCGQSLPGTTTWRSPSIVGAVVEKGEQSETMGKASPSRLRADSPGRAMPNHCSPHTPISGSEWDSQPKWQKREGYQVSSLTSGHSCWEYIISRKEKRL